MLMEQSDPSFNLIVVSDLAPGAGGAPRARAVDKDSLDALLRETGPSIEVPGGGARCVMTFQDFKDFRPERLAARVPAIANLLEFRKQVTELASGGGSVDAVRASLQQLGSYPDLARSLEGALVPAAGRPAPAPAAAPKPAAAAPAGSVFDLVDAEATPAPEAVSPEQAGRAAAKLIDAVLGASAGPKPAPAALRAVGAQAEAAVAPMLRAVLHDPRFQELEASWRGLRLLVRSVDFRAGCRLDVIAASRANLLRALRDAALPLADDLRSQGRTSCLLLDFAFDGSEDDLVAIAEDASSRSLPVLASAGLEVALRELAAGMGDASQGAWVRLRSAPAARWLALAANRFLLRAPYGAAGDPAKNLVFEEIADAATPLPWGRPGWLLGAFAAASFARTGWGSDFSGREAASAVEALPIRPGEEGATPLESELGEAAANALGEAGLLPLACRRGHDRPFAAGTSTVYKAKKDEPVTTLRYALFAAPVAASMESLLGHIDMTCSIEEIARTIGAALQLMGMTGSGSLYAASAVPVPGGRPAVAVRIRPQGGVLRGLPDLAFDVPIALH
jgi:type VI secretion system protein ImpC